MSPYPRNSMQVIDLTGKEGVYASFKCDEDNTYDYLLIDDISKAVIVPMKIDAINKTTCKKGTTEVSFVCEFNREVDPINIYVSAIINEHKASPAKIELQDFVDALCSTIYQNSLFEEHEFIQEVKRIAVDNLMKDCFLYTAELAANQKYGFVGRIIDNNNEAVGIINSFGTSLNEDNQFLLNLNDVVSYISLKDMNVSKIEFITGHHAFVINKFEIVSNTEGIIKQYKILVENCYSEASDESIIAETNNDIFDYDFFFDERTQLIASKEVVFNKNDSTQNTISNLFSDFEF